MRKHAPGADVCVAVHAGEGPGDEVVLVVDDRPTVAQGDGQAGAARAGGLAATGGGYGVQGMRERAQLLGGTLSAGSVDSGWRVELRLPAPAVPAGAPERGDGR